MAEKERSLHNKCADIASYAAALSVYANRKSTPFKGFENQIRAFLTLSESFALGYKVLQGEIEEQLKEKKTRLIRENESHLAQNESESEEYNNSPFASNYAGYSDDLSSNGVSISLDSSSPVTGINVATSRFAEKLSRIYQTLTSKPLDLKASKEFEEPQMALDEKKLHEITERAYNMSFICQFKEALLFLKDNSKALAPIVGVSDYMNDNMLSTALSNLTEKCIDETINNPYAVLRDGVSYYFGPEVNDLMDGQVFYKFNEGKAQADFYKAKGDPYESRNFNEYLKVLTGIAKSKEIKGNNATSMRFLENVIKATAYAISKDNQRLYKSSMDLKKEIKSTATKLGMEEMRDFVSRVDEKSVDLFLERLKGKTDALYLLDANFKNAFDEYSRSYNEYIKNENETTYRHALDLSSIGRTIGEEGSDKISSMNGYILSQYRSAIPKEIENIQFPAIMSAEGPETKPLFYYLSKFNAEQKFKAKLSVIEDDIKDITAANKGEEKLLATYRNRKEKNKELYEENEKKVEEILSLDADNFGAKILLKLEDDIKKHIIRNVAREELDSLLENSKGKSSSVFLEKDIEKLLEYHKRMQDAHEKDSDKISKDQVYENTLKYAEDLLTSTLSKEREKEAVFYNKARTFLKWESEQELPDANVYEKSAKLHEMGIFSKKKRDEISKSIINSILNLSDRYVREYEAVKLGFERSKELIEKNVEKAKVLNRANENIIRENNISRAESWQQKELSEEDRAQIERAVRYAVSRLRGAEKFAEAEKTVLDSRNSSVNMRYFYAKKADRRKIFTETEQIDYLGLYWEADKPLELNERIENEVEKDEKLKLFNAGSAYFITDRMVDKYLSRLVDLKREATFIAEMNESNLLTDETLENAYISAQECVKALDNKTTEKLEPLKAKRRYWERMSASLLSPQNQINYADMAIRELSKGENERDMDKVYDAIGEMLENNPSLESSYKSLDKKDNAQLLLWLREHRVMEKSIYDYQERFYPGNEAYSNKAVRDLSDKGEHFVEETRRDAYVYTQYLNKKIAQIEGQSEFVKSNWKALLAISGTEKDLYPIRFFKERFFEEKGVNSLDSKDKSAVTKEYFSLMNKEQKLAFDTGIDRFKEKIKADRNLDYSFYTLRNVYENSLDLLAEKLNIEKDEKGLYKTEVVRHITKFAKKKNKFVKDLENKSLKEQINFYKQNIAWAKESKEEVEKKKDNFVNSAEMREFSRWIAYSKSENIEREIKDHWENYIENENSLKRPTPSLIPLINYHLKGLNVVSSLSNSVYISSSGYSEREMRDFIALEKTDRKDIENFTNKSVEKKEKEINSKDLQNTKKINDFVDSFFPKNTRFLYGDVAIKNGYEELDAIKENALYIHLPSDMNKEQYITALASKAESAKRDELKAKLSSDAIFIESAGSAYLRLDKNNSLSESQLDFVKNEVVYTDGGKSTCFFKKEEDKSLNETFIEWNKVQNKILSEERIADRNMEEVLSKNSENRRKEVLTSLAKSSRTLSREGR